MRFCYRLQGIFPSPNPWNILPGFAIGTFLGDAWVLFTAKVTADEATDLLHGKVSRQTGLTAIAGLLLISGVLFIDWRERWLRLPSLDVERRVGTELVPRLIVLEPADETDRPVSGKPAREVIAVCVSVDFQEGCRRGGLG